MEISGGCHCGAVRFRAELPDPPVPALDCNCSVCAKTGFLHIMVPHGAFELITGRDALASYRFGTGAAEHLFCATCGVKSFYQPRSHPEAWSVNARCLDQPVELAIEQFDGRNWEKAHTELQPPTVRAEPVEALSFPSFKKWQSLDKLGTNGDRRHMHRPLRLTLDRSALAANWRWLAERAGTDCGAAVKANAYGLGATEATATLHEAGCRDFFVSNWAEAEELGGVVGQASLLVLHGVGVNDMEAALASPARPVLNSVEQVERWKAHAPDRPCDVMIDTGMNRLGLRADEIAALDGLRIDTLHSHLACADEDHALNAEQLQRFREVASAVPARRYSLANSAGICLGRDYAFDLVRPGIALYGGIPRREAEGQIRQVARIEAQVVQRRTIRTGESCGYGATFVAEGETEAAIVNIGYADGYLRGFSSRGTAFVGEFALPVLGRVSMDLVALRCDAAPELKEGDWVEIDYDLPTAAEQSGLSQYELLTTLGSRFERRWR